VRNEFYLKTRYCTTGENIAEKLPFFKNTPEKKMFKKKSLILLKNFFEEKKNNLIEN